MQLFGTTTFHGRESGSNTPRQGVWFPHSMTGSLIPTSVSHIPTHSLLPQGLHIYTMKLRAAERTSKETSPCLFALY